MPCYCYILQSEKDNSFYIGYSCDDLSERVAKHNRPHRGYTASKQPWKLVYNEEYATKKEAMNREKEIKSWKSHQRIEELISKEDSSRK